MFSNDSEEVTLKDMAGMMNAMFSKLGEISEVLERQQSKIDEMDSRISIGENEKLLDNEEARARPARKQATEEQRSNEATTPSSDRRKSVFMREAEASDSATASKQVVIHLEPPSHKHIYLDSTELSDFTKFIIQWFEYEQINGLKLEPAQIVSRRIRNLLTYNNNLSDDAFVKLTAERFCGLMAKETQVYSKVQFVEVLAHALRNMKVLDWTSVRPNTHEYFFQEILKRKTVFMRTFRIMMEANRKHCPQVSGKEYGLAYVFLNLIDEKYNKRVLAEIPKVTDTNFSSIEEFLDAYIEKANEHYQASKAVRLIPYESVDFQRKTAIPRREFIKVASTPEILKRETSLPKTPLVESGYQSGGKLNVVNEVLEAGDCAQESDDDDMDGSDWRVNFKDDSVDDFQDQVREMIHHDSDLDRHQISQLLAIDEPVTTRGCVAYALYGNCLRGDQCKHSQGHNEAVAKETRRWMIKKLSQMIQDEDNPRKILSRPYKPP